MSSLKYQALSFEQYQLEFTKRTFVMGILNTTPDSFSDGGQFNNLEKAVEQAQKLVNDGADILDIGGESTRPGSETVTAEEEIARVVPVIQAIRSRMDIPISIDTYKAETAQRAIEAGAHMINDVWGAKADPKMAEVAAHYDVPIILMHNRENKDYNDIIEDMKVDLQESIELVKRAGVKDERIILDPGIGFAKTYEHNLEVMRRLDELHVFGYPILLATSRKSFIGLTLDLPVEDRVEGTGATVCLGVERGCQFVRVHDVKEIKRMTQMMDAMLKR